MTRIKICGITTPEDARTAAIAGADAIGLVFAESPRQVTIAGARRIVEALPPYVSAVGVFVGAGASTIRDAVRDVGLSEIQLHGDESADFVRKLSPLRVTKALRVRDRSFIEDLHIYGNAGVAAMMLDAYSSKTRGGTGRQFDWDLIVQARAAGALDKAPPLILAGGLTSLNVKAGIRKVRPWGVDVSGGVEFEPGVKSHEKIERFVAAVRSMGAPSAPGVGD